MTEETAGTPRTDALHTSKGWKIGELVDLCKKFEISNRKAKTGWQTALSSYDTQLKRADRFEREVAALTTQRDELQKRIGYTAVPVVAGGANLSERLRDARRGIWQDICTVPNCDDILWFCRGDTFDGPRPPEIDDADYWDWWCYAEPPALPETGTAQATECETNGTELRAELDAAKRALGDLVRAYVSVMETGRDRIIALGGDCDPVDVMERGDPYLRNARAALAAKSTEQEGK